MDYIRIRSTQDRWFTPMHELMRTVFPPEEVLVAELWEQPLRDEGLRVYVAVSGEEAVGATEYRYYPAMRVAMTDFTMIGREGLGVGPFLAQRRKADLDEWVRATNGPMLGMFAEIYNPYAVQGLEFGGIRPMNPFVRREVLAHLGYRKLDMPYVHPSWQRDGEAVTGLDLAFMPAEETCSAVPGALVARFLRTYYAPLEPKPRVWVEMVEAAARRDDIPLLSL